MPALTPGTNFKKQLERSEMQLSSFGFSQNDFDQDEIAKNSRAFQKNVKKLHTIKPLNNQFTEEHVQLIQ